MTYKIQEIEGIGPKYGDTLAKAGITTTDDLLEKCADKKGRTAVAGETDLSETLLLKWANMADLMRIKGVGSEYSELLEVAGVDTVKELRNRNPGNLLVKMTEVNVEKNLVRALPTEKDVTSWVEEAKGMEPRITH